MTLTKKEQNIVLIIGAIVVAYGLYWSFGWWTDVHAGLERDLANAKKQGGANQKIIDEGKKAQISFEASRIQTLDPDRPDYAPTQRLIEQTFDGGGLVFTNWGASGTPRPIQNNREFQEAKYTAQATTTTARLARFLQYIEAAHVPARIDGIDISSTKPGVDNLRVTFTISAILYAPNKSATTARSGPRGAATGSRPVNATTRGGVQPTTPSSASAPSSAALSKVEEEMIKKREAEAARLATMPETPPPPKRTPEEIEQEMIAKRAAQEAASSKPATNVATPTTTTAPGGVR